MRVSPLCSVSIPDFETFNNFIKSRFQFGSSSDNNITFYHLHNRVDTQLTNIARVDN